MGAKVYCKKGYNIPKEGYVEFKENGCCPVTNNVACEKCPAEVFKFEEKQ